MTTNPTEMIIEVPTDSTDIVQDKPKKNRIIVPVNERGLAPTDFDGMYRIAVAAASSGIIPGFDSPEQCLIAIATGAEVGFSPMKSLQSFAVINGKATMYGDAMISLVLASGQLENMDEYFEDAQGNRIHERDLPTDIDRWDDGISAVCEIKRKGMIVSYGRFSVADAKQAGLWNKRGRTGQPTPWVTHPKRMMRYKARGFGVRDRFADYLGGLHMYEELQGEEPTSFQPSHMRGVQNNTTEESGGIASRIRSIPNEAKDAAPERPGDDAGSNTENDEPPFDADSVIEIMDGQVRS